MELNLKTPSESHSSRTESYLLTEMLPNVVRIDKIIRFTHENFERKILF